MSEDLRFRHDADARREAARLFAMGCGYGPVASMMSLPEEAVRNAAALLFTYLTLFITTGIAISRIEGLPILTCLFETGSAVGTVGLTLGITSTLSLAPRILLMILMFFGRVGPLTLIYAALPSTENVKSKLPMERISVG